jgi:hypothetical protein
MDEARDEFDGPLEESHIPTSSPFLEPGRSASGLVASINMPSGFESPTNRGMAGWRDDAPFIFRERDASGASPTRWDMLGAILASWPCAPSPSVDDIDGGPDVCPTLCADCAKAGFDPAGDVRLMPAIGVSYMAVDTDITPLPGVMAVLCLRQFKNTVDEANTVENMK